MNKPFILAKTKEAFEKKLNLGEIPYSSISFIEDTQQIWTQGTYYGGNTPHIFMSEKAYSELEVVDPNVLYCLYEDDVQTVSLPKNITITEQDLPYKPSNTIDYTVTGQTITSISQSPVTWVASLKDPSTSIWSDGTTTDKSFTVTVEKDNTWVFGDTFPITLSGAKKEDPVVTAWTFGGVFPIILEETSDEPVTKTSFDYIFPIII